MADFFQQRSRGGARLNRSTRDPGCKVHFEHSWGLDTALYFYFYLEDRAYIFISIDSILFKDRHGSSNDVFRKKYQKRVFAIF